MKELLDAARNGDFQTAKQIFDDALSRGHNPLELLNAVDRRQRSVAHYAAEYDDLVVIEWLHHMGADLFRRDDSNKSPIEITVLVDAKLRRKRKAESEVLPFLRSVVLNPIQQMFFLEFGESTRSVRGIQDFSDIPDERLSQRFGFHNNLQALHLLAMDGRLEELRYLKSRGVDMRASDDDGNTALHLCNSPSVASFLIDECDADVNLRNSSDGYTPAHSVIERVAMDDLQENIGSDILQLLIDSDADFSIRADDGSDVVEFALDMIGKGRIATICMSGKGAPGQGEVERILRKMEAEGDSDSDISVASHNDKVIGENGEEESDDDSQEAHDEEDESESEAEILDPIDETPEDSDDDEEFFIKRK